MIRPVVIFSLKSARAVSFRSGGRVLLEAVAMAIRLALLAAT